VSAYRLLLRLLLALVAAFVLVSGAGCRTPSFGPVDLSSPGWVNRTGQAIWRPDRTKPEIVGDLVLAFDNYGNGYLQFSKAFPLVSARISSEGWEIEFPPQNRRYAGPGNPPKRIGWMQLLRAWQGSPVVSPWRIVTRTEGSIAIENGKSGELIEAQF